MQINLASGTYVVAVSGGVDSVALLDMLVKQNKSDVTLVVAHFDHGIRQDSKLDADLVTSLANTYGLQIELGEGNLGPTASEEKARDTRHHFLKIVAHKHKATTIITAHHQDDVLETAIINMSRGTGRLGLASLKNNNSYLRPLLDKPKQELIEYCQSNDLAWNEDSTNNDQTHIRNYIRHTVLPKFSSSQRQMLLGLINTVGQLNEQIEPLLSNFITYNSYRRGGKVFKRYWFNRLPHDLCKEVVHHWFRTAKAKDYNAKHIDWLATQLKTSKAGKKYDVDKTNKITITKRSIRLLFSV